MVSNFEKAILYKVTKESKKKEKLNNSVKGM